MATVNFSVPEPVKAAFNQTFADENKSALIAQLMEQAVRERRQQARREAAIAQILAFRREQQPVAESRIVEAREMDRP